ncbi:hypothetical protein GCM10020220_096410 [Nonomuraea rubra]
MGGARCGGRTVTGGSSRSAPRRSPLNRAGTQLQRPSIREGAPILAHGPVLGVRTAPRWIFVMMSGDRALRDSTARFSQRDQQAAAVHLPCHQTICADQH